MRGVIYLVVLGGFWLSMTLAGVADPTQNPDPGGAYEPDRVARAKQFFGRLRRIVVATRNGRGPFFHPWANPGAQATFMAWCKQSPDTRAKLTIVEAWPEGRGASTSDTWTYNVWVVDQHPKTGWRFATITIGADAQDNLAFKWCSVGGLPMFLDPTGRDPRDLSRFQLDGPWSKSGLQSSKPPTHAQLVAQALHRTDTVPKKRGWTPRLKLNGIPVQESFIHRGYILVRLLDLPKEHQRRRIVERVLKATSAKRWGPMTQFFGSTSRSSGLNDWREVVYPLLRTVKPADVKVSLESFRGGDVITVPYQGRRLMISCFFIEEEDRFMFMIWDRSVYVSDEADYFPPVTNALRQANVEAERKLQQNLDIALATVREALTLARTSSVQALTNRYEPDAKPEQIEWFRTWAQEHPERSMITTALQHFPPDDPSEPDGYVLWVVSPSLDGSTRQGRLSRLVVNVYATTSRLVATFEETTGSLVKLRQYIQDCGSSQRVIQGPWDHPDTGVAK